MEILRLVRCRQLLIAFDVSTREITAHHEDLVYSALLASFWRKRALAKFLRSCGISEKFIGSWHQDETKRDFLDRLFERLHSTDRGPAVLRQLGRELAEQTAFPDLQRWEDSEEKVQRAKEAVDALRRYQTDESDRQRQEQRRTEARERYAKERAQAARSQQSLAKLKQRLDDLTGSLGTQKAGYDFEDWFYDLVQFSEIDARRPYKHEDRQIDGSITHDGTTYLVELKFTMEQAGAPDVDVFRRKVETKADNTMGVMVSMAGFSPPAIKSGSGPKTPLLLLDHAHIYAVLGGASDLRSVIERVRRHASQTGEAHLPFANFNG